MTARIIQSSQKHSSSIWRTVEPLPSSVSADTVISIGEKRRPDLFRGFGGAFTESAAYVWSQLSKDRQQQIMTAYFDAKHGIGYTFGRTHMNSCDFSLDNYAAVDIPGDKKLWSFSCEREKQYLWPFIHAAYKAAGTDLPLLLSPWSPPAWMKSNQSMNNGGALLPEYRSAWAAYFARYITELRDNGFQVFGVTVQNEPEATQTWDSCRYSASDEALFIREYLGPLLDSQGMQDVGIYFWDHNRDEMFNRAADVLTDPETAQYITGQAIHWYSGDQFDLVRETKRNLPRQGDHFLGRLHRRRCQAGSMGSWRDLCSQHHRRSECRCNIMARLEHDP
ncbi:MAG: hypothetical protein U5P10_01310 [Spirochaetia bacterium]|nr:hypothetical protein [Spirochaetia bacterium]